MRSTSSMNLRKIFEEISSYKVSIKGGQGMGKTYVSLVIILRFIALGTNDTDKYIIAGILYGLTFMVRPFIYRGMRKEK